MMTNRTLLHRLLHVVASAGICVTLIPGLSAHHSQSEYDLRAKVEVEGTVTEVQWRSRTRGFRWTC